MLNVNGNSVYKFLSVFLSGVLVTMLGAWATTARGVVTKEEFPALLGVYLPDRETLRSQNQQLLERSAENSARLQALEIEFARLLARVDDLEMEVPTPQVRPKAQSSRRP